MQIVKDKIISVYRCVKMINNVDKNIEEKNMINEKLSNISKEYQNLKKIDDKIMTIDEILDDIEK